MPHVHAYHTTAEVFSSWRFWIQYIIAAGFNFFANYGGAWLTLSKFGKHGLLPVKFSETNAANSSVLLDFLVTSFLIGSLCVILGGWGFKVCAPGPSVGSTAC